MVASVAAIARIRATDNSAQRGAGAKAPDKDPDPFYSLR